MLTIRPNRLFTTGFEGERAGGLGFGPSLLSDGIDRMFNELWNGARPGLPSRVIPPLNVWEDQQAIFIEAELPGMSDKDVEVNVTGNELTITGARTIAQPENAVFHRRERGAGRFTRSLRLGVEIDAEQAEAKFEHGVLRVRLPKAEAAKPRTIAVRAG